MNRGNVQHDTSNHNSNQWPGGSWDGLPAPVIRRALHLLDCCRRSDIPPLISMRIAVMREALMQLAARGLVVGLVDERSGLCAVAAAGRVR